MCAGLDNYVDGRSPIEQSAGAIRGRPSAAVTMSRDCYRPSVISDAAAIAARTLYMVENDPALIR